VKTAGRVNIDNYESQQRNSYARAVLANVYVNNSNLWQIFLEKKSQTFATAADTALLKESES